MKRYDHLYLVELNLGMTGGGGIVMSVSGDGKISVPDWMTAQDVLAIIALLSAPMAEPYPEGSDMAKAMKRIGEHAPELGKYINKGKVA